MDSPQVRYDTIGVGYSTTRHEEPSWAGEILKSLKESERIVNIGAGTGNYEPADRFVVALEPSGEMLQQRSGGVAVQGVAECLPFPDHSFDAAMAILTIHHWSDLARGLAEMQRVARRQVLFVFEPLVVHNMWLTSYFDSVSDTEKNAPTAADVAEHLDVRETRVMWIPTDCRDATAAAFWSRPEAYLDPAVQRSNSYLALMDPEVRDRGIQRLADELADGSWDESHGHLRKMTEADYGYRLVIAGD